MTENINEEIERLILKMLELSPQTFEKNVKGQTIALKIKESIGRIESYAKALGYIKHGTAGGHKVWAKALAATLIDLIETLPLLQNYNEEDTFKEAVEKRLSYKKVKAPTAINFIFGRVLINKKGYPAAKIRFDNDTEVYVLLNTDHCLVVSDAEYTDTFVRRKQHTRHWLINTRYEKLANGFYTNQLTLDKRSNQIKGVI